MRDLEQARRVTLEQLVEHLAQEHLALPDFEERVARVHRARSRDEVVGVLVDLPGRGGGR